MTAVLAPDHVKPSRKAASHVAAGEHWLAGRFQTKRTGNRQQSEGRHGRLRQHTGGTKKYRDGLQK